MLDYRRVTCSDLFLQNMDLAVWLGCIKANLLVLLVSRVPVRHRHVLVWYRGNADHTLPPISAERGGMKLSKLEIHISRSIPNWRYNPFWYLSIPLSRFWRFMAVGFSHPDEQNRMASMSKAVSSFSRWPDTQRLPRGVYHWSQPKKSVWKNWRQSMAKHMVRIVLNQYRPEFGPLESLSPLNLFKSRT